MTQSAENGIVEFPGTHSVDQTVQRLREMLAAKGATLFAMVDHSGEAEKAGLNMLPTKLLVFGSPKAGTPVMLAAPTSAIDLPLKILVRQDEKGKTWISYNSPTFLKNRHNIPEELLKNIAIVEALASNAAG